MCVNTFDVCDCIVYEYLNGIHRVYARFVHMHASCICMHRVYTCTMHMHAPCICMHRAYVSTVHMHTCTVRMHVILLRH